MITCRVGKGALRGVELFATDRRAFAHAVRPHDATTDLGVRITALKTTASGPTLTLAARASVRTANRPPVYSKTPLVRSDDRVTVLEFDLVDVPGTAGSPAAQRVNLKLQLVAGLQGLARPSVTDEAAWSAAFKAPYLAGAVLFLDFQNDEGVRGGVLPLLHNANEIDRMLLIEHGEGMMRQCNAAHRNKRRTYQ